MSALLLSSAFPVFTDKNGNPLEDGYIYIGTQNLNPETNPITVYFDSAMTIPAAQPIRTIGGYPSRNGSPAQLYVSSSCSMTVRNKKGTLIFNAPIFTGNGASQSVVDTVASLRLLTGLSGQNIATLGYWSSGDGGKNNYYYSTTSTATDNGGTVIKPTAVSGAGRWLAVNPYAVYARQFGAKGDGSTDDTTAIQAAIDNSLGSVIFEAGVYVCTTLTINKRVMFLGMRGTNAGANVWPRIYLKNGTNANLINITTTGVLYADKIDFWGNKAGQTGASDIINLAEDTSGSYVGANALYLTDCIVREGYSKGINCNKNRNGGRLLNSLVLGCDDAGFILYGSDWYCNFSEFGLSGGANLYTDFGASNDFVLCDFYYSGQNASYGSSKSNIYVGTAVNALTIANCQINSAYHHGIECASTIASGHYSFTGNQFGSNGLAAVDTYSNIQIGAAKASIKGNVHWDFGQKPKYLIETTGAASRVDFDDVYVAASYVTAVTNDETKLFNRSDVNGTTLGDGGYFQSRKSANDRFFKSFIGTEVNERFSIDGTGICRWGAGGGSATDVALLRGTANVLALAADDCFKTGLNTTANRPSAASVGAGSQFYDTTLSKPIWSDGAVWRDGAGTAV